MTRFTALADELLLQIAANLRTTDLASLAIATKAISGPTQDTLYLSPVITDRFQLLRLCRTLINRPELAMKIGGLEIHLSQICEANEDMELATKQELLVKSSQAVILSLSHDAEVWADRLELGRPAAWAGLLVALTPKLKKLSLITTHEFTAADLSAAMFAGTELAAVPGLASIKSLHMSARQLDADWCGLKNLQSVKVTSRLFPGFKTPSRGRENTPIRITSLSARSTCQAIAPSHIKGESIWLTNFITRLPFLSRLCIQLTNWNELDPILGAGKGTNIIQVHPCGTVTPGSFPSLLASISSLSSTLEHISIVIEDENIDFLRLISPMTSIKHFSLLKTLDLPQAAFLPSDEQDSSGRPHATDMLPNTLEYIRVTCSSESVLELLAEFSESRVHFNNLKAITLADFKGPGCTSQDLRAVQRRGRNALEDVGIKLKVR